MQAVPDMDPHRLLTASLRERAVGPALARILSQALAAVDPRQCIRLTVSLGDRLLQVGDRVFDLAGHQRIWVIGAGKAGLGMAQALDEVLGSRIAGGMVVTKSAQGIRSFGRIEVREAGHPTPDERSVQAGDRALQIARMAGPDDIVLCPISGGASSLLVARPQGLSLESIVQLTRLMLERGVPIEAINIVRRHLDPLKGGGLATAIRPARCIGLILSDVCDAPLHTVGSGPTAPDESDPHDALKVLERWKLREAMPELTPVLERSRRPVALGPEPYNLELASNDTAFDAACTAAAAEGFEVLLGDRLRGEARDAGTLLAQTLLQTRPSSRPICLIAGGETTVTLQGDGKGGRCQELALAGALPLFGSPDALIVSFATDGDDGPTDAAGAVTTGNSVSRALEAGLDPMDHLARNDAYPLFAALDDLIVCGPTGTNVCDLVLGVRPPATTERAP